MAKYFLLYSSSYYDLAVTIKHLMMSLGYDDVYIFDEPTQEQTTTHIKRTLESCDGVVALYGPPAKPADGVREMDGAEYPRNEAHIAIGARKPLSLIVHRGTRLPDFLRDHATWVCFDFWDPVDFQKKVDHIVRQLLGFKAAVEKQRCRASSYGLLPENPFSGYLDQNSVLFHKVNGAVNKITRSDHPVIPTKYLFAHADSYRLYGNLIDSKTYTMAKEGEVLFAKYCTNLVEELRKATRNTQKLTVVSLGIGMGKKEQFFLEGLCEQGLDVLFLAIDINPAFIQSSLQEVRAKMCQSQVANQWEYQFMIGDFDGIEHVRQLLPPDRPVLFLALGGTFGNQDEAVFLNRLSRSSEEVYLLMDFQTKESFDGPDKGGYESRANREFIQKIVQGFCNEVVEIENISGRYLEDLHEIHKTPLSSVPNAKTLVMVGETNSHRKKYVGYSTRYDHDSLTSFLRNERCEILHTMQDHALHTHIMLCRVGH